MRMAEDLLLHYASHSSRPQDRVRRFVVEDPRFAWAKGVLRDYPRADVLLSGAGLRDLLLGALPTTLTATVSGLDPRDVRRALAPFGNVDCEGGECALTFRPRGGDAPLYVLVGSLPPRDFTIDSLLYSLRRSMLSDPNHGLDDLAHRAIRVMGYPLRTFAEDPLRMLRALRLAAHHRLTFAGETWHALQCALPRLNRVHYNDDGRPEYAHPRPMLGAALLETLAADPRYGASLVEASGLGDLVAPELFAQKDGVSAWDKATRALDILVHDDTLRAFKLAGIGVGVVIAALLVYHERNSALARDLIRRFHLHQFPKGHHAHLNAEDVVWLIENLRHFHEHDPASMAPSAFEKVFGSARGKALLALMHAVFLADGTHHVARERLHVARRLLDALEERTAGLPKLVRGRDLSTLGVSPGPLYRQLMKKVRDAQLAGHLASRDDALNFIRLHIAKM
ncbi:CCA tRNA nucleotidyltransferase [Candidatus Uhrbacteria bacterium]|nr:CCA tRNA nucleotidyltransferase [Candidatus Uhrbacteria bacterium]